MELKMFLMGKTKKSRSLKSKTTLIIIINTICLSIVMLLFNVIYLYSLLKSAFENEIYFSGLIVSNKVDYMLSKKTLEKMTELPEELKNILLINKQLNYAFINNQEGKILYHTDSQMIGNKLDKKIYTYGVLHSGKQFIEVNNNYEMIIPINDQSITIGNIHLGMPLKIIRNGIYPIVMITAGGFIIFAVLIIFLLLLFITKSIIKPISHLSSTMKHITEQMKFDHEIDLIGEGEIKELCGTFNVMIQEIHNYSENLEDLVKDRTAELLEKNQKIQKDLMIAKALQEEVIKTLPQVPELYIDAKYIAMDELGGDVYDIRRIGKFSYSFLIADVSGHGVPAALITTMTKTSFINRGHFSKTTSEICQEVNNDMFALIGDTNYYLTAFYAALDLSNLTLQYTNCGHHKCIVHRAQSGEIIELDTEGFFIGIRFDTVYETKEIQMNIGDKLILFTDGFPEARNSKSEFYENERIINFVKKNGNSKPAEFINSFLDDVNEFCGDYPANDDRAILVMEIRSTIENIDETKKSISPILEDKNASASENDNRDLEMVIKLLGLDSKSLNHQINEAIRKYKRNEVDNSLNMLKNYERYFPNNLRILNCLAVIYYHKKEYQESLEYYLKIKQLDKGNKEAEEIIEKLKKITGSIAD